MNNAKEYTLLQAEEIVGAYHLFIKRMHNATLNCDDIEYRCNEDTNAVIQAIELQLDFRNHNMGCPGINVYGEQGCDPIYCYNKKHRTECHNRAKQQGYVIVEVE